MHKGHLTQIERTLIYCLRNDGHRPAEIARRLGRHRSTVTRELGRNSVDGVYGLGTAHELAMARRRRGPTKLDGRLMLLVVSLLAEDLSPEQVCMALRRRHRIGLSHQTIYNHVWKDRAEGGEIWQLLRFFGGRERYRPFRKGLRPDRERRAAHRKGREISIRPASVGSRRFYGDWEMDLMVGKAHRRPLLVLHERKSRYLVASFVPDRSCHHVMRIAPRLLDGLRSRTITTDNGPEFVFADAIETAVGCRLFYTRAYAAWEKGAVENSNGLLRQYFPKGSDFREYSARDLRFALDRLNSRPRKCLGGLAPDELLHRLRY